MPRSYSEKLKLDTAAANRRSRDARDIADGFPSPGDLVRRATCARDFKRFCEVYFPNAFRLNWSPDHLKVLDRIQAAVLEGKLLGIAMPRGAGKTTLAERAALWALLNAHRRFVVMVAATERLAEDLLSHLKTELLVNDLLGSDFRAVTYPIARLENNARRCGGQLFRGERTNIEWSRRRLVLPTMPDDVADGANVSGSAVAVAGVTGALRGLNHVLASGEVIRPDLVLLDDVQTRDSARSPSQCAERLATIRGDVLGLAGPGRQIAGLAALTVISEGDLADTLLDRKRHPEWHGERTQMVYTWPDATALWDRYRELRREAMEQDRPLAEVTEFYRANRAAMDAGFMVAWPERFGPDELSAQQHAMNLLADLGETAFFAEYQNAPLKLDAGESVVLTARQIAEKVNGLKRGVAPVAAEHLALGVDVGDRLLHWALAAWSQSFGGWLLDYGTYPQQPQRRFTSRRVARTLGRAAPGAGREGAIRAGLDVLVAELLGREWRREDGAALRIGQVLIDAGYVPDVVHDFCRHSPFASVLLPARGVGVGAKGRPIAEWTRRPGERHGWYWVVGRSPDRAGRYVRHDVNHWKTFLRDRLAAALGDKDSLSLYGAGAAEHDLFAEHLTAETPVRVSANGRTCDEWVLKPDKPDNHFLDAAVLACVGGSILGARLLNAGAAGPEKRQRVSFAEQQRRARERRYASA